MNGYVVMNKNELKRRHKRRFRMLVVVLAAVIVAIISLAAWLYWRSMTPTILEIAKVQVLSQSTQAINEAVLSLFSDGVCYGDLVTVEKNAQDDVVLLAANSVKTNKLARDAAVLVQVKLNSQFNDTLKIPLGTLSGVPLLSGKGPCVEIIISPQSSVTCSFVSDFISAGINQTLHRIYLNVDGTVDLIVPTLHHTVQILTPILVCETVIVGAVPETYLQGGFMVGAS